MSSVAPGPISRNTQSCIRLFQSVISVLRDEDNSPWSNLKISVVADELNRFKLWAGNNGAIQGSSSRASLDSRLQDEPFVAQQVSKFLENLSGDLHEVYDIASGRRQNRVTSWDDSASENSASPIEEQTNAELEDDFEPQSEILELFGSCVDVVSCLLQLCAAIRKAGISDRYYKATVSRAEPFAELPDILHVGQKYPKLRATPWLERRLARAITRRRQFLRYCKSHRDKLAEGTLQEVQKPNAPKVEVREAPSVENTTPSQISGVEVKANLPLPSILASTKATTLAIPEEGLSPEVPHEHETETSSVSTSSAGRELGEDDLHIPIIPADAAAGREFECPLCWTIQVFRRKMSRFWKKHVYQDLRPYVCTFQGCDLLMFTTIEAWIDHELRQHRFEWYCQICLEPPFNSSIHLENHMKTCHGTGIPDSQLAVMIDASKQPTQSILASSCPFCDDAEADVLSVNPHLENEKGRILVTPTVFAKHVGFHMQQLALFALPRGSGNLDDDKTTDRNSDIDSISGHAKGSQPIERRIDVSGEQSPAEKVADESPKQQSMSDTSSIVEGEDPQLHQAAFEGLERQVLSALDSGEDVNIWGPTWGSTLGAAVVGQHAILAKKLIDRGADLSVKCGKYDTIVQAAAELPDKAVERVVSHASMEQEMMVFAAEIKRKLKPRMEDAERFKAIFGSLNEVGVSFAKAMDYYWSRIILMTDYSSMWAPNLKNSMWQQSLRDACDAWVRGVQHMCAFADLIIKSLELGEQNALEGETRQLLLPRLRLVFRRKREISLTSVIVLCEKILMDLPVIAEIPEGGPEDDPYMYEEERRKYLRSCSAFEDLTKEQYSEFVRDFDTEKTIEKAQRPYFGRQRFRSLVDNINILESEKKYIENPPEERKESFDELSSEERDLLSSLFSDMKYFFSAITSSLTKLSAQSVTMKLHVSELGEIRSLCSSLEHVSTQVERHASSAQRYSYQSKLDIKRVHRTLDFLTWLLKKLWHDLTHADEIDQYTCLRTWMALNYIMETEFDHLGWMDDCACQRRLMECKEMLLMCCDSDSIPANTTPEMRAQLRASHKKLDQDTLTKREPLFDENPRDEFAIPKLREPTFEHSLLDRSIYY